MSKLEAELEAAQEYEEFRVKQDKTFKSDFDREVKKLLSRRKKNYKK